MLSILGYQHLSKKNRGDLDRQINSIKDYMLYHNPKNIQIITDVGSGLNDNRKGLNKLIEMVMNNKVDRIFISYKDRLTRFGLNYLMAIFKKFNVELIIVSSNENNKSMEEELAEDIVSIIHSFSGKLYGMRKKVKEQIDDELK